MTDSLAALTEAGVSIWLDELSRDRLTSGSLADLVAHDHVVGVTTNPTIFAKAIAEGGAYEAQLRDLAGRGVEVGEGLRALTTFDVRWACDVLRPVYEATGGVDGRVSIEVHPRLAHDTGATIAEARALWWQVDRPSLFIKIPAARQGLPAIAACLAEAISINVTLIFSLSRYDGVMDAFLDGMEQARDAGHDLSAIVSVASFFVSRADTEVDSRLDKVGTAEAAAFCGRAPPGRRQRQPAPRSVQAQLEGRGARLRDHRLRLCRIDSHDLQLPGLDRHDRLGHPGADDGPSPRSRTASPHLRS